MLLDLDALVERLIEAARNRYNLRGTRVVYGEEWEKSVRRRFRAILEEVLKEKP